MNELLQAAKAVIDADDIPTRCNAISKLRAAIERAERQDRVGFGEWFEYQDKYITAEETWTAAKEDERDRIRARAKLAADKVWKAGDWFIGPQHANMEKFVDVLLEENDE